MIRRIARAIRALVRPQTAAGRVLKERTQDPPALLGPGPRRRRPSHPNAPGQCRADDDPHPSGPVPVTARRVWLGSRQRIKVERGGHLFGFFSGPDEIAKAGVELSELKIEGR